jgi:Uma2 family endonuclease
METLIQQWTYRQMLAQLPAESAYELIANDLYLMPSPNSEHQEIAREISFLMISKSKQNQSGKVFFAPYDVILDEKTVVQPDILFVSSEKEPLIGKNSFGGVPDLVVEIVSPSSVYRDHVEKKELYERFGVAEYWVIDPANRVIEVLTLDKQKYKLNQYFYETGIAKSLIIKDFELNLEEIFKTIN